MIRTMIVDPSELARKVIAKTLKVEKDIRVVDHVASASEALAKLSDDNCDVVLVSASLEDTTARNLVQEVRRRLTSVKPVVYGLKQDTALIMDHITAGAAGYTTYNSSTRRLLIVLRAAASDQTSLAPDLAMAVIKRVAKLSSLQRTTPNVIGAAATLTKRERQVLGLIADGKSNQEIADYLVIQVGTAKNHVHRILKKLNVRNRREVAAVSARLGIGSTQSTRTTSVAAQ